MNIFYVHENPQVSAISLVDRHVVKMVLETAQLLSTAHRVLDGTPYKHRSGTRTITRFDVSKNVYQATHINHPCSVWVRQSSDNYQWLYEHFIHLLDEYYYRYGKKHKCEQMTSILGARPINIKISGLTTPACAMPEEYIISEDPIINYRNYYKNGKKHLHVWTKRSPPHWI